MRGLRDRSEEPHLLIDSFRSDTVGLLKTGIVSLSLHIAFLAFLSLSLKPATEKGRSPVYKVTIRPSSSWGISNLGSIGGLFTPLPVLDKTQIQKEENRPMQEIKQKEPEVERIPLGEQKQFPQRQEEKETVKEPTPLPIAEESTLNLDSSLKEEDNLPIIFPPYLKEQYKNIISNIGSGEGVGGSGWGGSGEGLGPGRVGSGWKGFQNGTEFGHGGSGWGGPGGSGSRQGGSGWGSGDGSGPGRGGSGTGSSRKGGAGMPSPKYAGNPKPVYPWEAREKGYQGEVLLKVEVLSNGRVGQIEVKKSSGYDILDQSALTAVKRWKFIPARKGEVAISVWVNIPIKFQLL